MGRQQQAQLATEGHDDPDEVPVQALALPPDLRGSELRPVGAQAQADAEQKPRREEQRLKRA